MLIRFGNWLADICDAVSEWFAENARQLRRCPICGETLYYGKTCNEMGKGCRPKLD